MKSWIAITEIAVTEMSRALAFYQQVLSIQIETVEMEGMQLGIFPHYGESGFVQLIRGENYQPSGDGTLIYFDAGDDMQSILDKIEPAGGTVLVRKTEIGPEMGFFAQFTDPEGNRLGLHSMV